MSCKNMKVRARMSTVITLECGQQFTSVASLFICAAPHFVAQVDKVVLVVQCGWTWESCRMAVHFAPTLLHAYFYCTFYCLSIATVHKCTFLLVILLPFLLLYNCNSSVVCFIALHSAIHCLLPFNCDYSH